MKKNDFYIVFAFVLMLCSVVILSHKIIQLKKEIKSNIEYAQNDNVEYDMSKLLLTQDVSSLNIAVPDLPPKTFVIVFPNDFCDICNRKLLTQLSLTSVDNLLLVAPDKIRKQITVILSEYDVTSKTKFFQDHFIKNEIEEIESIEDELMIFYLDDECIIRHPIYIDKKFNLDKYLSMHIE